MVIIKNFTCRNEEASKKEQINEAVMQFIFPGRFVFGRNQSLPITKVSKQCPNPNKS